MDRSSPTDMMLLKKEQKDAELDRKIEALRRKNEALMKRYQEVEEDKKRAEQEGMAMQSRKGKVEDLTITINKSPTEKRVVTKKGLGDAVPKGVQNQEDVHNIFSAGRGKRRQILVTAPGNTKGKRVVSERVEKSSPTGVTGIKLSNEGSREPMDCTAGRKDCSKSQVGRKQERKCRAEGAHQKFTEYNPYAQQNEVLTDLSIPTSSEEQQEYLRWKKEREEIDRERVARHKNPQGQWRRAWDMDKPELTFSEKGAAERGTPSRGGRNARRGHSRPPVTTESRGGEHEKRGKNVPVVGSKVKGKDRLTGRARRWDSKDEAEQLQLSLLYYGCSCYSLSSRWVQKLVWRSFWRSWTLCVILRSTVTVQTQRPKEQNPVLWRRLWPLTMFLKIQNKRICLFLQTYPTRTLPFPEELRRRSVFQKTSFRELSKRTRMAIRPRSKLVL